MKQEISELDYVQVDKNQPGGLVEGARGTAVSVHSDFCLVEFVDPDGYTIGLFDIPTDELHAVQAPESGASVAREE